MILFSEFLSNDLRGNNPVKIFNSCKISVTVDVAVLVTLLIRPSEMGELQFRL